MGTTNLQTIPQLSLLMTNNNKVDIKEVISLSHEVRSAASSLQSSFDTIKSNIDAIGQMNSFKGKAADSAKNYFKEFHSLVLQVFNDLFQSLDGNLSSHIAIFQSDVDSSGSTLIDSNYLKEHKNYITNRYNVINQIAEQIRNTINNISDISNVSTPSISNVTNHVTEVTQYIQTVDDKLNNFTGNGRGEILELNKILTGLEKHISHVSKLESSDRISTYDELKETKVFKDMIKNNLKTGKTILEGVFASLAIGRAAAKNGLRTELVIIEGKKYYRILATKEALQHLGIKPDRKLNSALKYALQRYGKEEVTLKYATRNEAKANWSKWGGDATKNYSALQYWSGDYKVGILNKAKTVGSATLKGTVKSFKDIFDIKSFVSGVRSNPTLGSAGKVIAPVYAGLSWYGYYNDAQTKGLSAPEAIKNATIDTAVDTAVGGAVQTFFTAAGTALIPIPGLGTFVGMGVGIFANAVLSIKFGKENKSAMDRIKGWFH